MAYSRSGRAGVRKPSRKTPSQLPAALRWDSQEAVGSSCKTLCLPVASRLRIAADLGVKLFLSTFQISLLGFLSSGA